MRERLEARLWGMPLGERTDVAKAVDALFAEMRGELLVAVDRLEPIGGTDYRHGFDCAKAALRSVVETMA